MEENYTFEKEYTISRETFTEGYDSFLKKFVYKKNYVYTGIFVLLAVVFIAAVVEDHSQYIAYMLIAVCIALAVRYWYNPRKLRNSIIDAYSSIEGTVYRAGFTDEYIDISTVSFPENDEPEEENAPEENSENPDAPENEDIPPETEDVLPEKSRVYINDDFSVMETEKSFLLLAGKESFYILPKESLSDSEKDIVKKLKK